ncbi:MAG: hypothetical protein U9P90_00695 [Patescibacteria group bacterium]|nr:hypothetical protein [Patescibacteria group bacterium]
MIKFLELFSETSSKADDLGISLVSFNPSQDSRIDLSFIMQVGFDKTMLVYHGIPFVAHEVEGVLQSLDIGSYEILSLACSVYYIKICLNFTVIPSSIIDVVFFHELREMYYFYVIEDSKDVAHRKAVRDEIEYVNRFLSDEEKEIYDRFIERVRPCFLRA